jgi:BASS family bile acid:Na+ symporter
MDAAVLIRVLNVAALVAIMLSIGMRVSHTQVAASARRVRLVASAVLANFVLVPFITAFLLYCFHAPPLASVGFLILAVCPGAPVVPPFTEIGRGDVSLATGLMVILAALSALLAPALLTISIKWLSVSANTQISYFAIVKTLLETQLLPLAIGLGVHERAPRLTGRLVKPVSVLANLLLLSVVGLILATQYQTLEAFRLRGWIGMLLLLAATLGTGWVCGGQDHVTRRTLAVTTGVRNAALALVIVSANFSGTPALTAVVGYALVSIFGTFAFALLIRKYTIPRLQAAPSA